MSSRTRLDMSAQKAFDLLSGEDTTFVQHPAVTLPGGEEVRADFLMQHGEAQYLVDASHPGKPDVFFGTEAPRKMTRLGAARRAKNDGSVKVLMVLVGDFPEGFFPRLHGFFRNYAPPGFEWMVSWEEDQFLTSDEKLADGETVIWIEDPAMGTEVSTLRSSGGEFSYTSMDLKLVAHVLYEQYAGTAYMGPDQPSDDVEGTVRNPSELASRAGVSRGKAYDWAGELTELGYLSSKSRDEFRLVNHLELLSGFRDLHQARLTGFRFEDAEDPLEATLKFLHEQVSDEYRALCTLSGPAATRLYPVEEPCDGPVLLYRTRENDLLESYPREPVPEVATFLTEVGHSLEKSSLVDADLVVLEGDPPYRLRPEDISSPEDTGDDIFVADPVGVAVDSLNLGEEFEECAKRFLEETLGIEPEGKGGEDQVG